MKVKWVKFLLAPSLLEGDYGGSFQGPALHVESSHLVRTCPPPVLSPDLTLDWSRPTLLAAPDHAALRETLNLKPANFFVALDHWNVSNEMKPEDLFEQVIFQFELSYKMFFWRTQDWKPR